MGSWETPMLNCTIIGRHRVSLAAKMGERSVLMKQRDCKLRWRKKMIRGSDNKSRLQKSAEKRTRTHHGEGIRIILHRYHVLHADTYVHPLINNNYFSFLNK